VAETPAPIGPDVPELLNALRERAAQADQEVRLYDIEHGMVQRISREVASLVDMGSIRPDVQRLVSLLENRVDTVSSRVRFHAVGTVQHVGNGVARLSGLPNARTNELVTFPTGVQGMALNLEHHYVDVILLGAEEGIQGGDLVTGTGERLRVPVGHQLLGRVLNPLGEPLDEEGRVDASTHWFLEHEAPGVVARSPVNEPLHTGWKMIDALIPIGRGQRELILGDRQTGKTTIAVDAILNQRAGDVACIYVAVGQKKSSTLAVIETLRAAGALAYTTVVMSGPDDPPALRYLAPYTGCTMAEGIMREGRDVLIVYDDLSKHADSYRELSLLLRRPPGREAYPGDIFYLHSRLLERACKLSEDEGGGSITALPIVETQQGNMSAYIPTNLISITDGQILLDSEKFNRGIKPAVDVGRSVSRVGGAAQIPLMKELASDLRLELSQYEEVARFARFGTEVDEATQQQIQRGERLRQMLIQPAHRPMSAARQLVVLQAAKAGLFAEVDVDAIPKFERRLLERFGKENPTVLSQLERFIESRQYERVEETFAEVREKLPEMAKRVRQAELEEKLEGKLEGEGVSS
jgi:F-type H+/Na+-transporting ATPase subunit alpha